LDEAPPGDDLCRAPRVYQDLSHIIAEEVYRVFANRSDYDGVVLWEMLKLQVYFGESYWYMGPWSFEMFAFEHMIYFAKVVLSLPLRFMNRFIRPSRNGIDHVHHWAFGIVDLRRPCR
jgi:hypothetical protein